MKTINNYIQGQPSGEKVGKIINVVMAICGGSIILLGAGAQLIKWATGYNVFAQLF